MSCGSKSARNASKSSLEAAAEAAAKVNAMLIAKGKLKLPTSSTKPQHTSPNSANRNQSDLYTAEVEINDAPVASRNLLTKGHTQDEINKKSGAAISTRGRYMTYEDKVQNSRERPLYLHVQASMREAVDRAVQCIQDIVLKHLDIVTPGNPSKFLKFEPLPPPVYISPPQPEPTTIYHEKVYVGLEHAPGNYPLKDKLIGPGLTYLSHISSETGAVVQVVGKGSGSMENPQEPLHVHLTHTNPEHMKTAKALTLNLVQTVQSEFSQWQQQQLALATLALQNHAISVQVTAAGVPVGLQTVSRVPNQAGILQQAAPTTQVSAGGHHLTLTPTSNILTPVAIPISTNILSQAPVTLTPQQTLSPYPIQTSHVVPTSATTLVANTALLPPSMSVPPPHHHHHHHHHQFQTQEMETLQGQRVYVTTGPPQQHPEATVMATQVIQQQQAPYQTHLTYQPQAATVAHHHQFANQTTKYLIPTIPQAAA